MTLVEQAESYLDQAQPDVDAGRKNPLLADRIRAFVDSSRGALAGMGRADLSDQLDAAVGWLSQGTDYGPVPETSSPTMAGLKTFAGDSTSLDDYWGEQAKVTLKSWGSKAAAAIGAGADSAAGNLLKSPTIVAAGIVLLVLAGAWAYRSFR